MQEAIYEGKYFNLKAHLDLVIDNKEEIKSLKKRADKGAFICPYCNETLIIKSGEIREEHFSHRHSKSCEVSVASEVYHKQVERETKKHSVIKEIIYDELKTQEKFKPELNIDYGYISKAAEKWKYYPDIIIKNKDKELAITILTDVSSNNDEKFVKQIKNRNRYYIDKKMVPIWFVENTEQSVDMENRVIHLWEAELDIAVKTEEDKQWEKAINDLHLKKNLYEIYNYYHTLKPLIYDVRSLYYVHTTDTNIVFSVQRFIKDQEKYPYRAFALNKAYQMNLSTALWTTDSLQLSDPVNEKIQITEFLQETQRRIAAEETRQRNEPQQQQKSNRVFKNMNNEARGTTSVSTNITNENIINYIQTKDVVSVSALEVCEFLIMECGASQDTYLTGKYKIYTDVCLKLESLIKQGILELAEKNYTNDRFYKILQNTLSIDSAQIE